MAVGQVMKVQTGAGGEGGLCPTDEVLRLSVVLHEGHWGWKNVCIYTCYIRTM